MRSRPLVRGGMTVFGLVVTLAGTVGSASCAAVPDIQFVPDDARSDAPGVDAAPDGAGVDGSRDGAAGDAGVCTSPSPGAGATCCGSMWCVGQCDAFNCDDCAQKARSGACAAGDVCCGKAGNVVCKKQCP